MKIITRAGLVRIAVLFALLGVASGVGYYVMIRMPGESHRGPLPPLTASEAALAAELRRDVERLAGEIGERNVGTPKKLAAAADFIESTLRDAGYETRRQTYKARAQEVHNIEAEITGVPHPERLVVVGAHYDSVLGAPGADDNGSGAAALLALARRFAGKPAPATIRFVAFVNEEPPFFETKDMGSLVYARRSRERGEDVRAMLSLETIGYYSDADGSQRYPAPFSLFYPSRGDFIAFVGNVDSRALVRRAVASFRAHASGGHRSPFV
jgi:hypothetical protein